MTSVRGRLRDNAPLLLLALFAIVVAGGVVFRVRYLQGEMLSRWGMTLEGGNLTTKATVDEWFADRSADATALASAVAAHAAVRAGDVARPYANVLEPVRRRGKFTGIWILDSTGTVASSLTVDSLRPTEHAAARAAITTRRQHLSAVTRLGKHAAFMSIAVPVPVSDTPRPGRRAAAAVVMRVDIVAAFAPWAGGRRSGWARSWTHPPMVSSPSMRNSPSPW